MIIDVGCGGNRKMSFQLHGKIEADVLFDLRKPLKSLNNFVQGDVNCLPFKSNSFEKVYCYHVLEHLIDPILGMKELLRITKNVLEIKVPHRHWKLKDNNRRLSYGHKHHFCRKYFDVVFKNFDRIIKITSYEPKFLFFMSTPQEILVKVFKK